MSGRLLIVIATYNEADSLPILTDQLFTALPDAQILVIDDNSPDGTGDWCDAESERNLHFEVLHRDGKLGLGTATIMGLKHAIEGEYQLVATLDADLSHDAQSLSAMVQMCQNSTSDQSGVVIGSRYVQGGQIHGWPWYRRFSSFLVNQYARLILRLPTRDNTSAMRVYRISELEKVDLSLLKAPGYAYLEEILLLLKQNGVTFTEYPIIFRNREIGASKVSPLELASSLYEILKLSFRSFKTS